MGLICDISNTIWIFVSMNVNILIKLPGARPIFITLTWISLIENRFVDIGFTHTHY